jgi:hypothetical protein
VCAPVAGIAALLLANLAQSNIEESHGVLAGLGYVKAAKIIAWIEIAVSAWFGISFILGQIESCKMQYELQKSFGCIGTFLC